MENEYKELHLKGSPPPSEPSAEPAPEPPAEGAPVAPFGPKLWCLACVGEVTEGMAQCPNCFVSLDFSDIEDLDHATD